MMRPVALSLLLLGLAACADSGPPPRESAPPPRTSLVSAPPPRPAAPVDSCGARGLQYLVGRPRTEIPVPLHPSMRRVVCLTCPISDEIAPMRQTILYDPDSGLVREVRCG